MTSAGPTPEVASSVQNTGSKTCIATLKLKQDLSTAIRFSMKMKEILEDGITTYLRSFDKSPGHISIPSTRYRRNGG